MRFAKYHALGNDYLVLEPKDCPTLFSPEAIRKVCHRHFGLGSDGRWPSQTPVRFGRVSIAVAIDGTGGRWT